MKKSILRASAALQAIAIVGAGSAAAFMAAAPAAAQDYTAGVITGVVRGANGAIVPGATVTLRSEAQGFTNTVTTGADGRFSFPSLPAGAYDVSVQSAGNPNYRADNVE
ncbi:MAG TPA: carboxypeptidase-like regulatory domain-containing protein, partial [Sphingomicrobium sp.]|nr:carboxypeptidase-like regulatory domain-containing protein [Sphingomicrobium sp.]